MPGQTTLQLRPASDLLSRLNAGVAARLGGLIFLPGTHAFFDLEQNELA